MKYINFYGVSNKEKHMLMLYVGKIFSMSGFTLLRTKDTYLQKLMSQLHYSDSFEVSDLDAVDMSSFDYVLIDIHYFDPVDEGKSYLVSGCYREEVAYNANMIDGLGEGFDVLYLGLLYDFDISAKYLSRRYKIADGSQKVYEIYLSEKDIGLHLKNEYNDGLQMKGLSKAYLKVLLALIKDITKEERSSKKLLKQALRK